jgi:hypothetical protein
VSGFPEIQGLVDGRARWTDVMTLLALVPWACTRPWQRLDRRTRAPLAAWVLLGLATTAAHGGWAKLAGSVVLVLLFLMSADLGRLHGLLAARITAFAAVALAAAALAGFVLFYAGIETPLLGPRGDLLPGPYPRVRSLASHPNLLGSYAIFAWALASTLPRPDPARRAGRAAAALCAWLALSRAALSLFVAEVWWRWPRRRAVAVVVAVGALLMALTMVNVRVDPTRPWAVSVDVGGGVRRAAAIATLEAIRRRPWLGCGVDCTPGPWDAHCTPLQIAATRGLPALAVFMWLLTRLKPDGGSWTPEAAGVVALLVDGLTQDVEDFRHLWVLMGMAAARARCLTDPGT